MARFMEKDCIWSMRFASWRLLIPRCITPPRFSMGTKATDVISGLSTVLTGWRGFVCGDPGIVQTLKKKLFLAGMASRDIYADAFLPAAVN